MSRYLKCSGKTDSVIYSNSDMRVLLVTAQLIEIKDDGCYCDSALFGTLELMSELGELYIIAGKPSANMLGSIPRVQRLDFIKKENVEYFKPMSHIRSYFVNNIYNNGLLKRLIPQADLVVGYLPNIHGLKAIDIAHKYGKPCLSFVIACAWDALHNHQRWPARMIAPSRFFSMRKVVRNSEYVHYVTTNFLQHRYPTKGKELGCSDTNLRKLDATVMQIRLQRLKERKLPDDIVSLVTTAHIDVRFKGQEYVIRAISELKKRGDNRYRYYLIGGGRGEYLRNLSKRLGVEKEVSFLGRKKWNEVIDILINADIYIQPSLQEGLPRSVVEAMSTALPCIGFNTGGIPELIEDEFVVKRKDVTGIIDCLLKLQDKTVYAKTAERNFHLAEEFEHDKLVARIKQFYKEIRQEIESKKD